MLGKVHDRRTAPNRLRDVYEAELDEREKLVRRRTEEMREAYRVLQERIEEMGRCERKAREKVEKSRKVTVHVMEEIKDELKYRAEWTVIQGELQAQEDVIEQRVGALKSRVNSLIEVCDTFNGTLARVKEHKSDRNWKKGDPLVRSLMIGECGLRIQNPLTAIREKKKDLIDEEVGRLSQIHGEKVARVQANRQRAAEFEQLQLLSARVLV